MDFPRDAIEIIIVDNDSSDGTAARIAAYPVTKLCERRRGPGAA